MTTSLIEKIRNLFPRRIKIIPHRIYSLFVNHKSDPYYIKKYFSNEYIVKGGVFTGMKYLSTSYCSSLLPKICGTYEKQIYPWLGHLDRKYDCIFNIGCAEGYYAVGLARKYPGLQVIAYDIDRSARILCKQLAALNSVINIKIKSKFNANDLSKAKNSLIICDIEGNELELLDPEKYYQLLKADIIVECHDFVKPITKTLINRFLKSHVITQITDKPCSNNENQLLRSLPVSIVDILTNEHRPVNNMVWLRMINK